MRRLIPGLIMTALWVLLLLAGPAYLFWLVIVVTAILGLREYFTMTLESAPRLTVWLCSTVSIIPVAVSISSRQEVLLTALFLSLLGSALLAQFFYSRRENGLEYLYSCSLATLYISFCLAHLVMIRTLPEGVAWLLVLTAVTAGGDTGAYYIGRTLGRHKLCPRISPGKTVEGAIGGIIVASACAVLTGVFVLPDNNPFLVLLAALLLALVSIVGDLLESIIKRSAGFKDSGTLLFGHGGVLDRIDSLLIAGPVLYTFLYFGIFS